MEACAAHPPSVVACACNAGVTNCDAVNACWGTNDKCVWGACQSAASCQDVGLACYVPACTQQCCSVAPAPAGTPCNAGGGTQCDGAGHCK